MQGSGAARLLVYPFFSVRCRLHQPTRPQDGAQSGTARNCRHKLCIFDNATLGVQFFSLVSSHGCAAPVCGRICVVTCLRLIEGTRRELETPASFEDAKKSAIHFHLQVVQPESKRPRQHVHRNLRCCIRRCPQTDRPWGGTSQNLSRVWYVDRDVLLRWEDCSSHASRNGGVCLCVAKNPRKRGCMRRGKKN